MPNLAVESLSLSHFRSHHLVQIDCDPRPVAIYGANGAGKTNILEAVSLLVARPWRPAVECGRNDTPS